MSQGRNGERHNWNLDVGRDLFGGDALRQGGGRGLGRHTGLHHVDCEGAVEILEGGLIELYFSSPGFF